MRMKGVHFEEGMEFGVVGDRVVVVLGVEMGEGGEG